MCAYSDQWPHGHGHIRPFHTCVCPSSVCWQELVEAFQTWTMPWLLPEAMVDDSLLTTILTPRMQLTLLILPSAKTLMLWLHCILWQHWFSAAVDPWSWQWWKKSEWSTSPTLSNKLLRLYESDDCITGRRHGSQPKLANMDHSTTSPFEPVKASSESTCAIYVSLET